MLATIVHRLVSVKEVTKNRVNERGFYWLKKSEAIKMATVLQMLNCNTRIILNVAAALTAAR